MTASVVRGKILYIIHKVNKSTTNQGGVGFRKMDIGSKSFFFDPQPDPHIWKEVLTPSGGPYFRIMCWSPPPHSHLTGADSTGADSTAYDMFNQHSAQPLSTY
jgi:hypothetical protein